MSLTAEPLPNEKSIWRTVHAPAVPGSNSDLYTSRIPWLNYNLPAKARVNRRRFLGAQMCLGYKIHRAKTATYDNKSEIR